MSVPALDTTTIAALVKDATTAPSMHNAQPWRFRFLRDSGTVELYADHERAIPHADPAGRALHIGCGAALLTLRVAAVHAGREPHVRLLPDPERPHLLATVDLSAPAEPGGTLAGLYPAIARRHTSRYPFADTPIPSPVRDDLREAARLEGAALDFPGPWHVRFLLDLVEDAEGLDMMDPDRVAEVEQWTRIGAETAADDGVPEYAFGPRRRGGRAPVRDFAGRRHPTDLGTTDFEEKPQLALLGTERDRPGDWLRAGQALQRVLLRATSHELVASVTSQALEWRDLRWAAREPLSTMAHVHLTLRLGYGPVGPTSPRRAVRDVLDFV
ncbi:Acg family FMN-binding oxidoreductase [Streptomyces sp. NPDC002402]